MRKFAIPSLFMAVAAGLAVPLAVSRADDSEIVFPPEMLKTAPALSASRAMPPVPTLTAAPAEQTATVMPDAVNVDIDPAIVASTRKSPRAAAASENPPAEDAVVTHRAAKARIAAVKHRHLLRHVRHAHRRPMFYPVETARVPLPPVRVAQTQPAPIATAIRCAGFCGNYVLVGVGF
jgi:hypothetical protein